MAHCRELDDAGYVSGSEAWLSRGLAHAGAGDVPAGLEAVQRALDVSDTPEVRSGRACIPSLCDTCRLCYMVTLASVHALKAVTVCRVGQREGSDTQVKRFVPWLTQWYVCCRRRCALRSPPAAACTQRRVRRSRRCWLCRRPCPGCRH